MWAWEFLGVEVHGITRLGAARAAQAVDQGIGGKVKDWGSFHLSPLHWHAGLGLHCRMGEKFQSSCLFKIIPNLSFLCGSLPKKKPFLGSTPAHSMLCIPHLLRSKIVQCCHLCQETGCLGFVS